MASVGRDAAVELAIAGLPGVLGVEAAILVDGMPGRRSARVAVLVDDDAADAVGAVGLAALDALRAAHGAAVRGSLAVTALTAGVRRAVPPDAVIAAAGLRHAIAAGDEVLLGPQTLGPQLPGRQR